MTGKPVFLVACAKSKTSSACAAKDLYRSDWFRKARAYVEAQNADWYILSAEHGLMHPDTVVAPYDTTLKAMSREDRQAWSAKVYQRLIAYRLLPGLRSKVVILAGETYREFIERWMTLDGRQTRGVEVPLRGLALGQQKAWFKAHTPEAPEPSPAAPSQREIFASAPDERPPVNEDNDHYIEVLRRRKAAGLGRRWDTSHGPYAAGFDLPLFARTA